MAKCWHHRDHHFKTPPRPHTFLNALAVVLAGGLLLILLPGAQALTPGDAYVNGVGHTPSSPAPGGSFNMSISLDPDLEFEWTKAFVCSVTVGYCYAPVRADLLPGENHTYGNSSNIEIKEGHVLGYKFIIKALNDTLYSYPSANTTIPGLELVELKGVLYFKVQVQGNYTAPLPASDAGFLPGAGTSALAMVMVVALMLRRRPVT